MAEIQTQKLPYKQSGFEAVHAQGAAEGVKTPFADMAAKAFDGTVKGIDAFMKRAVQLDDFSARQAADVQLNRTLTDAQTELDRRLELPDGDDESFYDAGGTLRQNQMQDFLGRYREQIAGVSRAGILPQTREELYWKSEKAGDQLAANFIAAGVKRQRQKAESNFDDNYKLAMEQNRWGDAAAIAQDGAAIGLVSQSKAALMVNAAQKTRVRSSFDELIKNYPDKAAEVLASPEIALYFTPNEQNDMREAIQKRNEELANEGVRDNTLPNSVGVTEKGSAEEKRQKARQSPETTGFFNADEVMWIKNLQNGVDVEKTREQILVRMEDEAARSNPKKTAAEWEDEFLQRYKRFYYNGKQLFSDEQIKGICKAGRTALEVAIYGDIDYSALLKQRESNGGNALLNSKNWAETEKQLTDASVQPGGKYYEQFKNSLKFSGPDIYGSVSKDKNMVRQQLAKAEMLKSEISIIAQFRTWRASNEGKHADKLAQAAKLREIAEAETGSKFGEESPGLFNQTRDIMNAAYAAFDEFNAAHKREMQFPSAANPLPEPMAAVAGYAPADVSLAEDEILLPRDMMAGIKPGESVVQLTFSNKRIRVFRVAGSCEGDIPLMSHDMGVLGFNVNKTQDVLITPVTEAMGQKLFNLQEALQRHGTADTSARLIIGSEARLDKNGNLKVYETPEGWMEVAGIDTHSHPKEAAQLIYLVNTGRHKQAMTEAARFITAFTNEAANYLKRAGVENAGAEYVLRDLYFNAGPGGMKRVIRLAMGLPKEAGEAEVMRELTKYTPEEVVSRLHDARAADYERIARVYPQKSIYLSGWRNRNNAVTRQAFEMLRGNSRQSRST
ncbi:MAG: hypothetical protein LUE08_07155 [Akkermansiaceae bacterium]|nr:hypothetical protein [Akkermansiaceae bacterium]